MSRLIAPNLKRIREAFAWTQEALAAAATVDVRTIQRAEAGNAIAADTLRGIAAALDVSLQSLTTTLPSDEEMARLAAQWNERYSLVPLTLIEHASTLRDFFADSCALHFNTCGLETREQEQAAASLQEMLNDCGLIWSDLSPTEKLDWWETVAEQLRAVQNLGLAVTAGHELARVKLENIGDGTPFTWGMFFVIVARQTEPKLYALRDKTAPLF